MKTRNNPEPKNNNKPLRLLITGKEDLVVLSALLQDSILQIGDFAYMPRSKKFIFACIRFLWENQPGKKKHSGYRIRHGVNIALVERAQSSGLSLLEKKQMLNLLSISYTKKEEQEYLRLTFSGGGRILLDVEAVEIYAGDIGKPWRTPHLPSHDLE